ncbi:MAG: PQQ-dependent sugar dehydrogenase [Saprospiraceae bacterium]
MNVKLSSAAAILVAFFFMVTPTTAQLPSGFVQVKVADELNPTGMTLSPDGHLFLIEKNGVVRVVDNGVLDPIPALNLPVDDYNERGLGGITFHPTEPFVYLYYTVPGANRNRISRFDYYNHTIFPQTEEILLNLDPLSGTIHNAGAMVFGSDGKLYVSVGDGAASNQAQNPNSLLGKILRLNPDGSIPTDNPFYNTYTGVYRYIYALGFRNSFTMAIQPGTGRIYANDVGNSAWEEVNAILPGKNYGWPQVEGPIGGGNPPANYQDPVYAYTHAQGCSVIGGTFYNPTVSVFPPAYSGRYFFADYCGGYIKTLDPNTGAVNPFAAGLNRPIALQTMPGGDMYYIVRAGLGGGSEADNTSTFNGQLWRIIYTGSGAPFVYQDPESVRLSAGEDARFEVFVLGDPTLTFKWLRNGVDIPGADSAVLVVPAVAVSDSGSLFSCIVTNSQGTDISGAALLEVSANQRPQPQITVPDTSFRYRGGSVIPFAGLATDPEEGVLDSARLSWSVVFFHDNHTHPGLSAQSGLYNGSFPTPAQGETSPNVFYRIYLNATDTNGFAKSVYQDVQPLKSTLRVTANIPNATLQMDGTQYDLPADVLSVAGIRRQLNAPPSIVVGDSLYLFDSYLGLGADPFLDLVTPDTDLVIQLVYVAIPVGSGTGLLGRYFDAPNLDFSGDLLLTRVDSIVDFDWGNDAPDATVPDDYFSVEWRGFLEPLFTEELTLSTVTDDGVRLWIDGVQIIDQWIPQSPTTHSGKFNAVAGVRYPIRMQFMEIGGGAVARLQWQSQRLFNSVVPQSQLYPSRPGVVSGKVWIENTTSGVFEAGDVPMKNAVVSAHNSQTNVVVSYDLTDADGLYRIENVPDGLYYLSVMNLPGSGNLKPDAGLDSNSRTPLFVLDLDVDTVLNASFRVISTASVPAAAAGIRVFPNPATAQLHIVWPQTSPSANRRLLACDALGRVVHDQILPTGGAAVQVDLSNWHPGLYRLLFYNGQTAIGVQSVVVER